jgi:hypothetical protein
MSWIAGSDYDLGQRHAPVLIDDYTSTKRWVCPECSQNREGQVIEYPFDGVDWPCLVAEKLIASQQWDAILFGIKDAWRADPMVD